MISEKSIYRFPSPLGNENELQRGWNEARYGAGTSFCGNYWERAFCSVRNLRTASYLISLFISDGRVCSCVGRAVDREACMGRMVPVLQVSLGAYEECS